MEISKLNVGQICSVKSFIKGRCYDYEYRKERKFLGFVTAKEGFYETWSFRYDIFISENDIKEKKQNVYIEGEYVFYNPFLEVRMSNQSNHRIYFKTEKELNDFMESDVMKGVNWINQ